MLSSSKLGALPGFGGNRGLSSKSGYNSAQLELDDALGSLLDDSSSTTRKDQKQPKDKTKTKPFNSRVKGSNSDTDFYSQFADQADDNFDDSEDMVEITPVDTKKMADSVDVDDMEASLFGSFSRSQNQKRQLASLGKKNAGPSPSTDREPKGARRATTAEQGTAEEIPTQHVGLAQPPRALDTKPIQKEKPQAKKFDFDDDILDLLSDSDSEDKAPKKRVKPKIQLKTNPKRDESATNHDSKPITSSNTTTEHTESDFERPKTGHGRQSQSDTSSSAQPVAKSGKVDILKLDSTPEHLKSSFRSTKASKSLGESFNSTNVDFGDGDDDILSGMGFDDSSSKASVSAKRKGSRLDELLGKKKPVQVVDENKQPTGLTENGVEDLNNGDEDGFQFGGYLPSAATDTSSAHGQKLPAAKRRQNSDSLTFRPSSAPGPGKKTVRFAEAVENDNRPSSSPATNDTPKPALKGTRRASTQDQDSKTKDGSTSFSGKPPLPRKSEPAGLTAVSKGQGEVIETPQDKMIAETNVTGGEESLADNNDSLSPWLESTPKQSYSRTRGRRSSQQKSMANSLFEESQEQPEGDQDELLFIGNQTQTQESISKLQRPTFPWQKGRQSRSHSAGAIGPKDTTDLMFSTTNKSLETPQQPLLDQSSLMASFQEQLLQQQKQMQEQLKTLQSHQTPVSLKGKSGEEEKLRGELKDAQKRTQEIEKLVEEQKSQLSAKQVLVEELQLKVQSSEEGHKKFGEEYKVLNDKVSDLESSHQKSQLELQTQLEELKMKLYKVELERGQLKQSMDSFKLHHIEEMESVQKSHDARIKAMEDSFQRRETRWREEAEMESIRYQERLQQLEKEKTDVVLTLKKKIDTLEVSKTNEIGRLQDIHYSSVEDLKREHELDKQHLLNLHRQEVEALKAAHSHTRMLSDLSRQVESSTREVSQLQAKLESTHSKEMQEQVHRAKTHEEQLKTLEERLLRQQAENSAERERLQSLIAKLEVNISQQRKQIEQERWELQQEGNHLKVQQKAFEEERISSLRRIEEDKETLQQAKERFLTEQREVLTKCYEERRTLASEKAEVTVLQKRMQEKEQLASTKNLQVEAEYEASLTQIREESAHVTLEARQLKQHQQILKVEQESLSKDREKLVMFNAELQRRSQEIEEMHQSAVIMRENGEQALIEARRLQEQLAEQSQNIHSHWAELREKETRIATELLSLAHQRRELHQPRRGSRLTTVPSVESVHSLDQLYLPPQSNDGSELTPANSSLSLSHPPLTTTVTDHLAANHTPQLTLGSHHQSTLNPSVPPTAGLNVTNGIGGVYSPRASPVHAYDLSGIPHQRPSVKAKLAAIEQSRSLRNLELDARKDKEDLEEENEFLESLQLQNSNMKQLVW